MTGTFDSLATKIIAFANSILSGSTGDIVVAIMGMLFLGWIIYTFRHTIFGNKSGASR